MDGSVIRRSGRVAEGAAAVEDEDVASHEFGADHEHDGVGDILRRAGSGERGALDEVRLPFGGIAGHGNGAGCDGVDANGRGELLGENAGHENDSAFGNRMREKFSPSDEAANVSEIDDDAVARLSEIGSGGLGAEEGRFEIGVERGVPSGFGGLAEFGFEEIGSTVDEDVEALKFLGDARNELLNLVYVGKLSLKGDGTAAESFDFTNNFAGFRFRFAVVDGDVDAFAGETKSNCAANAFPCPGDEGHEALQIDFPGHFVSFQRAKVAHPLLEFRAE